MKILSYQSQAGFTLFELMIAIAVIAILTAIGIPTYQGYVQKAVMTDMLQSMVPYKIAVEMCAIEHGDFTNCNNGSNGIPTTKSTNYVTSINVAAGVITLTGKNSLSGLTTTLTPTMDNKQGQIQWQRTCTTNPSNESLNDTCHAIFRF